MSGTEDGERPSPALARPYSWTEGRTEPTVDIAVEARVVTTPAGRDLPPSLTSAAWTITQLCLRPRSVAELAAYLAVPLGVVKVLVADLLAEGMVHVEATLARDADDAERRELIERVLSGLRAK
ncbi:MAG: DUF742 domain-containing protein [Actinomycetota bacterium]|nr:DUF742 domain-containing protein [Actinomycetota bacterium]